MIAFEVEDMSCGHCVAAITRSIQATDPKAAVQVDLACHRVEVRGSQNDAVALAAGIAAAGYTPMVLGQVPAKASARKPSARAGCCCG